MESCYRIDNLKGVHLTRHKHILTSVVSLTALAAHYTTVLMAQEKEKAFWTESEVTALVDYLHEHRSERAEGGNFKMVTFNGAARDIAPKKTQGPQKTGKMCQTKWTSLKQIYNAIDKYCKQSGINQWHPEYGANIQGEAAAAVFDVYVQQKSNSAMRPFRNSGWVYLERMQEILPVGGARGAAAFRATDVPAPSIDDEPGADAPGAQAPGSASSMSAIAGMSGRSTSSTSAAAGTSGDVIMSGTNTIASPPPSSAATRPTISTTSSTGKRSHDATSMFHDDAATFASTVPSSTSELPQQSEARASKKQKSHATQSRADSGQSAMMTSAARAAKITPAAAVVGMQGSINRLTDVIEKGMVTDAERLEKQRHAALHILNGEDADYYPLQERVIVMHMFADDPAVTDVYLQNDDKDTRYAFIQHMIQYRFQKVPQAPQVPYVRPQL